MEPFNNFLDFFIDMICSRCSKPGKYVHHKGIINEFLSPKIKN